MHSRILCLLIMVMFVTARADNNDGLVAKFTFNKGNLQDETGRHNAKGVGISFVEDRFGNPRSSCFLHGTTGSYLNLGTEPDLKPRAGSISVWVNIEIAVLSGQGFSINPIILTKNDSVDDFFEGYSITYDYMINKVVTSAAESSRKQMIIHSTEKFSEHKWHHIVITYDDHNHCLYIDGKLEACVAKNFPAHFLSSDSVMVGNTANKKNHRFLCASVDDILFYNRVLNAEEISELYNSPDPNKKRLVIQWVMRGCAALLLIILIMWLILKRYRRRLLKQEETNRINARLNELETRAIRTQMNPHFIFNSLNTLQRFILEEDIENSNLYLTKFSKLLRKLIESSSSDSISLKEEMDILRRYIEIEKMRFDNSFDYEITTDVNEPDQVFVPFMLVQPFVENAIWHGLLPKTGPRHLEIIFSDLDKDRILCVVDDNGVGRQCEMIIKNPLKKRSLALDFIRQRLELLQKSTGIACSFRIIDKKNESGASLGTRIEITIPKVKNYDTRGNY